MNLSANLRNFENWTEVTKGIHRNVVAAGCCYEIHVIHHAHGTDIHDATANLYLAGKWYDHGKNYFERELLYSEPGATVRECLEAAVKDYEENIENAK